jgi:arylsulfatase A-like enzyme
MPSITRRQFLGALGAGAAAWAARPGLLAADEPAKKPNFVILFTDDQGYGDLGCYGSPDIKTPNLDRMAAEGMKFTDFYAQPICTPSRAALMTGCYPQRVGYGNGVENVKSGTGLNLDEITVAEVLKPAGYATGMVGKWHLGDAPKFQPIHQGFDSYFGVPYANNMKPFYYIRGDQRADEPLDQATLTQTFTRHAIDFITKNKDRPFFLYLAYTAPHGPLFPNAAFKGKSAGGAYGDVVEEVDASAGQVLDTLKKSGLDNNTLVFFTSDNGQAPSKNSGSAGPLRGGKGSAWEGGSRVPCIFRWPGRIPSGKTCSAITATIDILPTFAKFAGAQAPTDRILDGCDISPLLLGQSTDSPHEYFFYFGFSSVVHAVRSGPWKLVVRDPTAIYGRKDTQPGDNWNRPPERTPLLATPQLYNLHDDLGETTDVASQHPDVVKKLQSAIDRFAGDLEKTKRPRGHL